MKKCMLVLIFLIILIFIFSIVEHTNKLIPLKNLLKQENIKDISFEPYSNEDKLKILVTVEDSENFLDTINYVDENGQYITLKCEDNKNKLSIDYTVSKDGEYIFSAKNKIGQIIQKSLVVNSDFRKFIDIQITTDNQNESGSKANVTLNFRSDLKGNKYSYKIGKSTSWSQYITPFSFTSYDVLNGSLQEDDLKTVTIYAKCEDNANNKVIISKSTTILDLNLPQQPIITRVASGYPILTSDGAKLNGVVTIDYGSSNDIQKLYSVDEGQTWQEYQGSFESYQKVYARSVKIDSGLYNQAESDAEISNTTNEDALGYGAFDNNSNSFAGYVEYAIGNPIVSGSQLYRYVQIDRGAVGKTIKVDWADESSWLTINMQTLAQDKSTIITDKQQSNNTRTTDTINITSSMYWLRFVLSTGYISHGRIYEIFY